jgi:hypothetical protein
VVVSPDGAMVCDARIRIAPPEPQPSVWLPRLKESVRVDGPFRR